MTRIYLRVQSSKCEPSSPCNRYYFDDGTMVDLNADVRCVTCANWHPQIGNMGRCHVFMGTMTADFACAKWEKRSTEPGPRCRCCGAELQEGFVGQLKPCKCVGDGS